VATELSRSKDNPWKLRVRAVGSTVLHDNARCIEDLHAMPGEAMSLLVRRRSRSSAQSRPSGA
jgi:hypothetical protein